MNNISYISLGSNMGERLQHLKEAVVLLDEDDQIEVVAISSIYETDPVGYTDQALFLNAVLKIRTSYDAEALLKKCLKFESDIGRKRIIRWGPRTIDLDILLYNQENIETENLTLPHPRMTERAFVIIPLLEIEPGIKLPPMETSLFEILEHIQDKEGVRLWKRKNGEDVFALFES